MEIPHTIPTAHRAPHTSTNLREGHFLVRERTSDPLSLFPSSLSSKTCPISTAGCMQMLCYFEPSFSPPAQLWISICHWTIEAPKREIWHFYHQLQFILRYCHFFLLVHCRLSLNCWKKQGINWALISSKIELLCIYFSPGERPKWLLLLYSITHFYLYPNMPLTCIVFPSSVNSMSGSGI